MIGGTKNRLNRIYRISRYAATVLKSIASGTGSKKCPCCDYSGPFDAIGSPPRYGAYCPNCGSYERHRLLALSDRKHKFYGGKEVLHFAPEIVVRKLIEGKAARYVTADLEPGRADTVLNIEDIDCSNNQWDVIVCSHVLEHVNDKKALAEMYRILRDYGVLIVMVPIVEGWERTYENDNVIGGPSREEHFGQSDHIRYYGSDLRTRISSQGFIIEEYTAFGDEVVEYGLLRGEKVFICKKQKP